MSIVTNAGTHRAPKAKRRGRKIGMIAAALVLVPTLAFAAWQLVLGMSGSISTATVSANLSSAKVTDGGCQAALVGSKLQVTWGKATPGDACSLEIKIGSQAGDLPLRVQNAKWSASQYVKASLLGSSCGAEVPSSTDTTTTVRLNLTLSPDTPMGTSLPADATAGITLVKAADYDVAKCNV